MEIELSEEAEKKGEDWLMPKLEGKDIQKEIDKLE